MPSQLPSTLDSAHSTPPSDDEVLVRVEGVSKKFCRSLKKSLWYGVCDIASELNPFGRNAGQSIEYNHLTTIERHGGREKEQLKVGPKGEGMGRTESKDTENAASASGEQTGSGSESLLISEICGQKNSDAPDGAGLRDGEFWAVKGVSFELRRGECLGLIGHNGAGKTTLLKMLNGLIKPDAGSITMRGRVGALIALGAGFNPILTGRENIYINGSVLGLTKKEIDQKIDEIIDFAEIREFIDTPVQNYSSGMQVRLGFAVATALDPDVLILDEVLAVGDAKFRNKCYNKIGALQKKCAVIFVSHSMSQVARISSAGLFLQHGRAHYSRGIGDSIKLYESAHFDGSPSEGSFIQTAHPIERVTVHVGWETPLKWQASLNLSIELCSSSRISDPVFYGVLYDEGGAVVASFQAKGGRPICAGKNHIMIDVFAIPLASGVYPLSLVLSEGNGLEHLFWSYKQVRIAISDSPAGASPCRLRAEIRA